MAPIPPRLPYHPTSSPSLLQPFIAGIFTFGTKVTDPKAFIVPNADGTVVVHVAQKVKRWFGKPKLVNIVVPPQSFATPSVALGSVALQNAPVLIQQIPPDTDTLKRQQNQPMNQCQWLQHHAHHYRPDR